MLDPLTPYSTQRRTALTGWQSAEVYQRRSRVSFTIARISSSRNWFIQIGSVGEETPPEAMILMQGAPRRSSSRAALMQASTPSTTTAPVIESPQEQ